MQDKWRRQGFLTGKDAIATQPKDLLLTANCGTPKQRQASVLARNDPLHEDLWKVPKGRQHEAWGVSPRNPEPSSPERAAVGKGAKDRVTMLPSSLKADLREHLKNAKRLHEEDLRAGNGKVYLPHALSRKYPGAAAEWGWQYVFPAPALSRDPRSGERRRHHLYDRSIQKTFHEAARAKGAEGYEAQWMRSEAWRLYDKTSVV